MYKQHKKQHFDKSDDPFINLKHVFITYGYHKLVKYYSGFAFIFHTCSMVLEIHYMIKHFSMDLVTKYGGAIMLMNYFLISQIVTVVIEKLYLPELVKIRDLVFWKIDSFGSSVKEQILNDSIKMKRKLYFVWILFAAFGIILLPICGDFDESHLFPKVYETYFGTFGTIFYYFYVSSFPFVLYTSLRIPVFALYGVLQLHVQIILLNHKIRQLSHGLVDIDNVRYQERVSQNLCLCFSQHVALKNWLSKCLKFMKNVMPVYFCLAIICIVIIMFFILNNLVLNTSTHMKLRFFICGICSSVVLYIFSEAGQLLSDDTGGVFQVLMECPWYCWNTKNRKIYTMFLLSAVKPLTVDWGGLILNYNFGNHVFRTCSSYALILYKLRKAK
ncbi:odorant receptor 183 [Tribolium castaneum]|uniref:Odorant receptor n=1 Tax=Tribolium castaneum TaxID=7070 RepID=D6WEP1_TRICA|nr:odorant receptor 183 [Tribolium castaneum]